MTGAYTYTYILSLEIDQYKRIKYDLGKFIRKRNKDKESIRIDSEDERYQHL